MRLFRLQLRAVSATIPAHRHELNTNKYNFKLSIPIRSLKMSWTAPASPASWSSNTQKRSTMSLSPSFKPASIPQSSYTPQSLTSDLRSFELACTSSSAYPAPPIRPRSQRFEPAYTSQSPYTSRSSYTPRSPANTGSSYRSPSSYRSRSSCTSQVPDDPPKSNPRQPLPAYPLPKRLTTPPWRKSYRYR